jgi:hypothetical protein
MRQQNSLIVAANKAMDNATVLLENENTPFNAMYKQYKILQSLWFRAIEDASDTNNKWLEDLCVDLECMVQRCDAWLKEHAPSKQNDAVDSGPNSDN